MDILLVDDDMVDRAVISRTLKKSNLIVSIVEATGVEQALKLYTEQNFDVILLDYNLPLRNGIEMIVEVRNSPKDSSTAIVMMSTSEDEALALECIKEGAQDFLIKSEISDKKLRRAILHSTARHNLEKQLFDTYQKVKTLAETDFLTGLPNRYFFDESLKLALTNNRQNGNTLALLLLDIDNFKLINDNFGHDTGDIFLKKTVSTIRNCLRGNEVFARLGGDEFAITLANLESSEHAILVAQRIINAMQEPLEIASTLIHSTVSHFRLRIVKQVKNYLSMRILRCTVQKSGGVIKPAFLKIKCKKSFINDYKPKLSLELHYKNNSSNYTISQY